MRFVSWSYRYAEQILNSKLALRKEIEDALSALYLPPEGLKRPELNIEIEKQLVGRGWAKQPRVAGDREDLDIEAKLDFINPFRKVRASEPRWKELATPAASAKKSTTGARTKSQSQRHRADRCVTGGSESGFKDGVG